MLNSCSLEQIHYTTICQHCYLENKDQSFVFPTEVSILSLSLCCEGIIAAWEPVRPVKLNVLFSMANEIQTDFQPTWRVLSQLQPLLTCARLIL